MSEPESQAATRIAPARSWRSRFRLIHLAPVLAILALGAWVYASPVGASPDDDFHLTSIWCANALRTDLCEQGPKPSERIVPPALLQSVCFAYKPTKTPDCQQAGYAQSTNPSVTTDRGSFQNNYPPVYYALMNIFAGRDLQVSALFMRFVNVLLLVGIVTALYSLLPLARRTSLLWGWIIAMVPLGLFLVASNNPSSWAIIGVGSSWLALLGYFETTGRRRVALGALFCLTVIMAAGARGDGAAYSIVGIVVACTLSFRRGRSWLFAAILPAALALVSGVFYISSRQALVAVTGLADKTATPTPLDSFGVIASNLLNVQSLWAGVFGGWSLGWLDTALPAVVSIGGLAAFVAVAFTGIGVHAWRKSVSIVFLSLVLWILPSYVLFAGGNLVGQNVQPRYLLPLIVMVAGLAALSVGGRSLRLGPFQQFFVVLTLAIAQSIALHFNLRRYVTGVNVQGFNLDSPGGWWWTALPLSPMGLWVVGSLAFTGLLVVLVRDLGAGHEIAR